MENRTRKTSKSHATSSNVTDLKFPFFSTSSKKINYHMLYIYYVCFRAQASLFIPTGRIKRTYGKQQKILWRRRTERTSSATASILLGSQLSRAEQVILKKFGQCCVHIHRFCLLLFIGSVLKREALQQYERKMNTTSVERGYSIISIIT